MAERTHKSKQTPERTEEIVEEAAPVVAQAQVLSGAID